MGTHGEEGNTEGVPPTQEAFFLTAEDTENAENGRGLPRFIFSSPRVSVPP